MLAAIEPVVVKRRLPPLRAVSVSIYGSTIRANSPPEQTSVLQLPGRENPGVVAALPAIAIVASIPLRALVLALRQRPG